MIPPALQEIVDDFAGSPASFRLEMLLGFANGLPPLPERFAAAGGEVLQRVPECQTPFFLLVVELDHTS